MSTLTYILGWPLLRRDCCWLLVPRNFRPVMRAVAVLATLGLRAAGGHDVPAVQRRGGAAATSSSSRFPGSSALGISYHVGVDGINVGLILMGAIVAFAAACCLLGNQDAREGILHPAAGHGGRHPRRVRLARPVLLLLLPRAGAGADVHHDRRLGPRRAEELRHVPDHALPEHRRAASRWSASSRSTCNPAPARSTSRR